MPKRKLSELNGAGRSDDSKTRKLSIKAVRLTNKFDQGVQLISRGLKTARGFERQKLSRREKTAKLQENNSTTLARLHEEVEALKGLDYQVTAERYLFKQLSKTKRIAESPTFKEFQESKNVSTEGPKSTAEANILARLFKSNPVKNVMPNILAEIRKLLGIEETPTGKQGNAGTKKDVPAKEKLAPRQLKEAGSEPESASEKHNRQGLRSGDGVSVSGDDESGIEEFSYLDARLARGSDSEEEFESDADVPRAGSNEITDDISDSGSRSPSPAFSAADSPPSKKTKGSKASATPATNTTFLPSLMMGGYWSGSEEATDDEEAAGPPKRKNRMGQQARRALWEKKYGTKANHVQQEHKKHKNNRDSGWDPRRGAVSADDRGGRGYRGGRGGIGAGAGGPPNRQDGRIGPQSNSASGQRGKPQGPPKDSGPLHPSWEAKRRQKEQASTAAFQGTKVVFD